ncbi:MAG: histidine phosphatase family protein [Lautropia sp.]|nr:histidine phosphatase family protein [Lautropia sp.]
MNEGVVNPLAMSCQTLWLVRHPKPVGVEGLCYGRLDVVVDPDEVSRVASTLAARLPAGIALRSSPATRCRALADALLLCRPDLRWLGTSAWLAEMDFGDWEGRRWAEIPADELRAWTDDFSDYRAGCTGESVRAFLARIGQGLTSWRQEERRPAGHGQMARVPGQAREGERGLWFARGCQRGDGRARSRVWGGDPFPGHEGEVWITHAGVMRAIHWLRQAAPGQMPSADQWPAMAVGYGEAWCQNPGDGF